MKYNELKKEVKKWGKVYGYKPVIDIVSTYIEIGFKDEYYMNRICLIHKSERFVMDLIWGTYSNLSENAKGHFFEIVTKFAATKPNDREDEEDNLDLIIHRLKETRTDVEDVMNWVEEIQERSRNLRNALEDMIIYLEERKEANKGE